MRKIVWLLCATLFLAIVPSCKSTKTSTAAKMLKFNFEKGKTYDYDMSMTMDQEIQGQSIKMDGNYYYSMNVTGEEGENKSIVTKIDRFSMKMVAGTFNLDIDTDKPQTSLGDALSENDPGKILNSVFGMIKGQVFTLTVNPEGKVLEVSGFENMANNIFDSIGLEQKEKENALSQFSQQFNAEKMKSQFERVLYIFPNKEVNVGESWQKITDMDAGEIKGKYKSTYKVTDIEGEMVTLSENSIIESEAGVNGTNGTVVGTLVVDSRTGLVVSADQDIKMSVSEASQKVDMSIKVKIKGTAR
ncbi:MAG TPA: DUF6263 family protein [Chitinophagaceae bacterium]|jgi:hypothetical protein|nr:DUF6263 family protein [Chitinophagaceae bacterium]